MAQSHNAQSASSVAANQIQAMEEINKIKTLLQAAKFNTLGWFSRSIKPVALAKSVSVPKTVYDAYHALIQQEKTDPMKALALFYAHFCVAVRPEHDHTSRQEETRQFYQNFAEKKGSVIFPDNSDAAILFDKLLKDEVDAMIVKRSPEQKAYLDFQAKVQTEINNVQAVTNAFTVIQTAVSLENKPNIELEITFLGKVIDRMRMAELRDDVIAYSKDALMVLNSLSVRVPHQEQIRTLRECIMRFQQHHCELMTDLTDKKNALYFAAALQAAAVAISTPLAHMIPVPANSVLNNLPYMNVAETGIETATSAKLEDVAKEIEEKKGVDHAMLHNIYDATKKETSLSDKYANAEKSLKETIQKPETKQKAAKVAAVTVAVVMFPYLAVPAAVLSTVYAAGGVAYNLYTKHDELAVAEKTSMIEKNVHESEMQIYRKQVAGAYSNQKVVGYWNEKNQVRQQAARNAPANNDVYVDAAKIKKA